MQENVLHYTSSFTTKPLKSPEVRKKFFATFATATLRCDFWVSVTSFWEHYSFYEPPPRTPPKKSFRPPTFHFSFPVLCRLYGKKRKRVFCIFKGASAPEPPKKVESRAESRAAQSSKFNYTSLYQCQLNTCLHLPHLFRRSEFFYDFDAGILK